MNHYDPNYGYNYQEDEEGIYDEWGFHNSAYVTVDFLLPTGIYIPLNVERNASIEVIKKQLWKEAISYPLYSNLQQQTKFVFTYVTGLGNEEEIVDETKRLCEVDLLHDLPMLKLVKAQGNQVETGIKQDINSLADTVKAYGNHSVTDREMENFRYEFMRLADQANKRREMLTWKELLIQYYPPTLDENFNENTHILLECGYIDIKLDSAYNMVNALRQIKLTVRPEWTTEKLTSEALDKLALSNNKIPSKNPDDYVLKASGKEYIVGNIELYKFQAVRNVLVCRIGKNISSIKSPVLTLLHSSSLIPKIPQSNVTVHHPNLENNRPLPNPGNYYSLWEIKKKYNVRVVRVGNLESKQKIMVHLGVYHGEVLLCNPRFSGDGKEIGKETEYHDEGSFDIELSDLPRTARLCFSICKPPRKKKATDYKAANISDASHWVNMNVFDYNGFLQTGKTRLYCWPWPTNSLDYTKLNCAGVVAMNPDTDTAPYIDIQIEDYNCIMKFPNFEEVLEEAAKSASQNSSGLTMNPSRSHIDQLKDVIARGEVFEDEKKLLWLLRMDLKDKFPRALPLFLQNAVKWNSYKNVAEVQALLQAWPPIKPDEALALLGPQYADEKVREYAVKCLEEIQYNEIKPFLLQLTQVIKFEPYHDNKLVRFILDKAWRNRKIGHFLFWHLKSEVWHDQVKQRFSLILEAYLYGNIPHMKTLLRQVDALQKMKMFNDRLTLRQQTIEQARKTLKEMLIDNNETLKEIESTLNPGVDLQKILPDDCNVMNSKMRPLWLTFSNQESADERVKIIYKKGDDLRQDMLTLQIIGMMDMMWRQEGLDLRMLPYGCLPTGKEMGLIEVVGNANTIARIQKAKVNAVMSAFQQNSLLDWIKEKNKTPEELDEAIDNFTASCAGYCVATYIIGVGDRHSDNIMVTEKGQLFHIDFGHILGNMKSKLGINRERVPFVLAHDFVYVINRGQRNARFDHFRQLCDKAFLIIRKKGNLFLTLFELMLAAELKDLSSKQHLDYLRESLALNLTDDEALVQFHGKLTKAIKNSWSTSVNWFFHNVAKK